MYGILESKKIIQVVEQPSLGLRPIADSPLALKPSLRVYHEFKNGALGVDSSGNNRDAVTLNNVNFVGDKILGTGVGFNGTDSYFRLADDALPEYTFTMMFWSWMNIEQPSSHNTYFASGSNTSNWGFRMSSIYNSGNAFPEGSRVEIISDYTSRNASVSQEEEVINLLVPVHRAVNYAVGTKELIHYINGVEVNRVFSQGFTRGYNTGCYLGKQGFTNSNFLNGGITDFAIFDESLTIEEINSVLE
jgi:hypothetical protein